MEREGPKLRRLLLVPCPYQGHINPMLHLATFLHRNGFSITIAHTSFNSLDPSRHPEFCFVRLHDGLSDDNVSSWDPTSILLAINENCRGSLEEELADMTGGGEDSSPVACIIHDELMYFCEAVANQMGLRSMVLRTTSAATCVSRSAVLQLHAQGHLPVQGSMLEAEVKELHPLRFKDLPLPATSDFFKSPQLITNMYTITTASAVIWNTMSWLEPSELTQTNTKIPIFPIAPIHKVAPTSASLLPEDSNCLSWLHKQRPHSVIYVSLGSVALLSRQELEEMAWGLAGSGRPFLWVIRPGSVQVQGSDWTGFMPEGFGNKVGDRGCIVQWAPQKEVLAHTAVGVFWSHCGWNSTLESLSEGVPMLCRPYSGDQRVNARYISFVWRVGLTLEDGLQRKEVEKAIRRVVVEEEGKKMRERAMDFKRRIEASLREDGSSYCILKELVDLITSF